MKILCMIFVVSSLVGVGFLFGYAYYADYDFSPAMKDAQKYGYDKGIKDGACIILELHGVNREKCHKEFDTIKTITFENSTVR